MHTCCDVMRLQLGFLTQDLERLVQNAADAEDESEDDEEDDAPVKSITRHGKKSGKGAGAVGLLTS